MIHATRADIGREIELDEGEDRPCSYGELRGVGEYYVAVRLEGRGYDSIVARHRVRWWAPPALGIPRVPADAIWVVPPPLAEPTTPRRGILAALAVLVMGNRQDAFHRPPRARRPLLRRLLRKATP